MSKIDSISETVTQTTRFLLTSSNYTIWVLPMSAKLEDIGIRTYVCGALKTDEKTPAEELARLEKLNMKAYSMIIQNLDSENLALVSTTLPSTNHFNGKALWSLLRKKYAGSDLVARSAALDHFLDIEFKNISSFCSAIRLANQKLVLADVLNDDQVKMMLMLRKLPRGQFQSFRDIVAMGFLSESFEDIMKRLEAYSISNNIQKDSSIDTQASMMTTASSSKSGAACTHCGKTGHRPHNCWKKFPEKAPKTKSAHLTVVDEYNQLKEVTNWCTLPDGTRMDADEIRYDYNQGM
ncbi:hypothetical protein PGTUg99_050070 [Puccinia graminis f. sp. tritici]|uniref:CCHC-type domain-containing protein n=1 Tax=Puccinia graminis f. sp. tritici TaxID=56615 RepID=A0A5B0MVU6_PUCGR|nr:hypothetical protein PGTUg99_050229 [Puccinia graminis f. sp. tritici]KAA1079989.1 hypothetical protein PGTUg99_050070 [Puccinia graminis f. sp. tritici]